MNGVLGILMYHQCSTTRCWRHVGPTLFLPGLLPTHFLVAILQCSDIDGTMVNSDSDTKEQFWMDARTGEFQVGCKLSQPGH